MTQEWRSERCPQCGRPAKVGYVRGERTLDGESEQVLRPVRHVDVNPDCEDGSKLA